MLDASFAKLKQSLIDFNFTDSFKICYIKEDNNKPYSIDGFHRKKGLLELEKEGYEIASVLPATYYQAETKKEAVEMMLAVFNSQYAKITYEGLYGLQHKFDLTIEDIELRLDNPVISLAKYKTGYGQEQKEYDENIEMNNKCPKCDYEW